MRTKSVVLEAREIQLAIELIELGARLQLLEAETSLSRDRLIKLYKELKGASPPKGMLPFSTDWFVTWLPNIHSSLFHNIYRHLVQYGGCQGIEAIVKAYRLYLEHVELHGWEAVLGFTRAWTLVRFFDSKMLQMTPCTRCGGHFVTHAHEPHGQYVCGLCAPPSRAGKTRKAKHAHAADLAPAVASGDPDAAISPLAA
ncbi:flagellar transcriptional regulator FlhC [Pandoraea sputorum]|uniref:Flagellar transcriptional regulator FlhC n=1 Tax=Pandoraea sputorum TaxID=93222 RepID=A0A239SZ39_9BURK|nr:flagellar transcriptional regulator FlhC [Pandoraea sputorum]APD12655.1 transcriptional regulator FlhC [Pandoraea sputorum]SNU90596.1 Flagellar transcriptional regulator FlhC [Pandoraea sputorum]VVE31997.1 transcriptional regulator FlhC [Pandoraea sputorum]VVE81463.1 transcriptional regulator FlhC [Pandoraea sputorum]BET12411.1 flagellar transcriptional regulator FlhC [Pandoraea sputorum]